MEERRSTRRVHEGKKPNTVDQNGSSLGRGSFVVQNRPKLKRHSDKSASLGNLNAKVNKSCPIKGNYWNIQ